MAGAKAKDLVSNNPVVVFSKSNCPYCKRVKELLESLGVKSKNVELDQEGDGAEIQAALAEWTGQRTVPNVFIGGKHIGGCDSTVAKHNEKQLVPLLQEAHALFLPSSLQRVPLSKGVCETLKDFTADPWRLPTLGL